MHIVDYQCISMNMLIYDKWVSVGPRSLELGFVCVVIRLWYLLVRYGAAVETGFSNMCVEIHQ